MCRTHRACFRLCTRPSSRLSLRAPTNPEEDVSATIVRRLPSLSQHAAHIVAPGHKQAAVVVGEHHVATYAHSDHSKWAPGTPIVVRRAGPPSLLATLCTRPAPINRAHMLCAGPPADVLRHVGAECAARAGFRPLLAGLCCSQVGIHNGAGASRKTVQAVVELMDAALDLVLLRVRALGRGRGRAHWHAIRWASRVWAHAGPDYSPRAG